MSMMSPECFAEQYKDCSLEELRKVRDRLIKDIRHYEKRQEHRDDAEMIVMPSPDVVYQCNNEYLCQIVQLINQKINFLLNSDFDSM